MISFDVLALMSIILIRHLYLTTTTWPKLILINQMQARYVMRL